MKHQVLFLRSPRAEWFSIVKKFLHRFLNKAFYNLKNVYFNFSSWAAICFNKLVLCVYLVKQTSSTLNVMQVIVNKKQKYHELYVARLKSPNRLSLNYCKCNE